jgi:hypothetical protein
MVSMLAPSATDREYLLQRSMERQVIGLLRAVRKPQTLAAAPLMHAVCRATGQANALAALEHVVGAALAHAGTNAAKLRSAILDVDFNHRATNAELARRCGVSRRHFQRWRADAVSAIARYARTIVEPSMLAPRAIPSRQDAPLTRFEREYEAYRRARDRGYALEMRAIAGNLRRLAPGSEAFALACTCRADASLRLGKLDEALEHLQQVVPPANLLGRARLALLRDDLAQAEEYAQAAFDATARDDAERYQSLVVISQARLGRSFSWRPLPGCVDLSRTSWERGAMVIECARHLAREAQWRRAETLALAEHSRAATLGYQGLAARAAGVLHACAGARGDHVAAVQWRAQAIEHLLATQDRFVALCLFLRPAYDERFGADASLRAVLYQRLCLIVPQMLGEGEKRQIPVRHLIAAIIDPRSGDGSRADFAEVVARAARSGSAFGNYAERCIAPVSEMLALAFVALTGSSWATAFERIRNAVAFSARELRPAASRAIAIAVPARRFESQFGSFNHLSFDDEPSVGVRAASQSRADLRLRLLSI